MDIDTEDFVKDPTVEKIESCIRIELIRETLWHIVYI